jgi:hypothetical protein
LEQGSDVVQSTANQCDFIQYCRLQIAQDGLRRKLLAFLFKSMYSRTDPNEVVDDYDAVPNIGLHNPEEVGPVHAQELAQGPGSCREELGPVAQNPDVANDVTYCGLPNHLQIT